MKSLALVFPGMSALVILSFFTVNAQPAFVEEAREDVQFLSMRFSAGSNDCYSFWLGDLKFEGEGSEVEVTRATLLDELGKGPSVSTSANCSKAGEFKSIDMRIVYSTGADVDYPVDKLNQVLENPGVGERLLYNATELHFENIRFVDADGVEHFMENRVYLIR